MNALDLLKQYEENALLGADLRAGSDFFHSVVDFLGTDELARNARQYAFVEERFRDEQRKCGSCGLVVDPVTGNHINEKLY